MEPRGLAYAGSPPRFHCLALDVPQMFVVCGSYPACPSYTREWPSCPSLFEEPHMFPVPDREVVLHQAAIKATCHIRTDSYLKLITWAFDTTLYLI